MQTGKIAHSTSLIFTRSFTAYDIVFTGKAWLLYNNLFFSARLCAADWIKLIYYAAKVLDSV